MALVEVLRAQLASAPAGWLEWVDGMRNTLVHRARRLTWMLHDESGPDHFFRPLPRNPGQTHAEAAARGGALFRADFLPEHALDSMRGNLAVRTELVWATATASVTLWEQRRADPAFLVQPAAQWPKVGAGTVTGFAGLTAPALPEMADGVLVFNRTLLTVSPGLG